MSDTPLIITIDCFLEKKVCFFLNQKSFFRRYFLGKLPTRSFNLSSLITKSLSVAFAMQGAFLSQGHLAASLRDPDESHTQTLS